jgi:hypothetical protein
LGFAIVAKIFHISYIHDMEYQIELTEDCSEWILSLSDPEKEDILAVVGLLEELGPNLGYPYSSKINNSKYSRMRELRIQHQGKPYRILYAFDPRRRAILLIGGNKTGDKRWYKKMVPMADKLYTKHLKLIEEVV